MQKYLVFQQNLSDIGLDPFPPVIHSLLKHLMDNPVAEAPSFFP